MSANIPASMDVPARALPAPSTVSPQIQVIVQEPISATWNVLPKTADQWKALW
jgi:epsilon-lactone hydrolase